MSPDQLDSVFILRQRFDFFTEVAAGVLPLVDCEFCGGRPGGHTASFPLLQASEFAGFTWSVNVKKLSPRVCTWTEFGKLILRARRICNDPTFLISPNSSLAPIEIAPIGKWPSFLRDIEYAYPGGPLLEQGLLKGLVQKGVKLDCQLTNLRDATGNVFTYGLVQPRLYRGVHARTFEENPGFNQCEHCGAIGSGNPLLKPPQTIYLDANLRKGIAPMFRVVGYEDCVFISAECKEALTSLHPSGFRCTPFGLWTS